MYTCNFEGCSAKFNKNWKLQEHFVKHTGERPFVCDFEDCKKSFTRKPHLQRHQQTHTGRKDFVCTQDGCGQSFTLRDNLKKHIKRKHAEDVFVFKCDHEGCGRVFPKKQTLKIHQYDHTSIKPFKCEYEGCEARYLLPCKLKRHAKQHEGYTCPEEGCDLIFCKWSLLRKHAADDHVTEYQCTECNKVFNKKYKLRVHMNIHRDTREVYMCPKVKCQFSTPKLDEVDRHIENYHEGARPFACTHKGCSKTFVYKHSMVKHQVVHSHSYVRPLPKPKVKRSLSSRISGYPDKGTRGLHQPKLLPEIKKQSTSENVCQRVLTVQPGPSTDGTNISTAQIQISPPVPDITMEETDSITGVKVLQVCSVVGTNVEIELVEVTQIVNNGEGHTENVNKTVSSSGGSFVEEKRCDIDLGAEVEVLQVVADGELQINVVDRNIVPKPVAAKEEGLQLSTRQVLVETNVSTGIESGAEDLDSLIQAVTKSRNNTTKETLNSQPSLKDSVLIM